MNRLRNEAQLAEEALIKSLGTVLDEAIRIHDVDAVVLDATEDLTLVIQDDTVSVDLPSELMELFLTDDVSQNDRLNAIRQQALHMESLGYSADQIQALEDNFILESNDSLQGTQHFTAWKAGFEYQMEQLLHGKDAQELPHHNWTLFVEGSRIIAKQMTHVF